MKSKRIYIILRKKDKDGRKEGREKEEIKEGREEAKKGEGLAIGQFLENVPA